MTKLRDPQGGAEFQVLVDQTHGATQISLVRIRVRPGQQTDRVTHWLTEEVWCVIQGRACFYRQATGNNTPQITELNPGDAVFVPPNYLCWVENTGPEDFVFFCCGSPPWQDTQEATLWHSETVLIRDNGTALPRPTSKGENTMLDRFEYKILVSDSDDETDEETLNGLGDQGWELVNAVADVRANEDSNEGGEADDQNVPVTVFYFKRRKEQA